MTRGQGSDMSSWILELARSEQLGGKGNAVLEVLAAQPRLSSYASAASVAEASGVNVATVIRTAQALGFSGWPALRAEIRARYLTSLTVPEIAAEHAEDTSKAFTASVQRDIESLVHTLRNVSADAVNDFVKTIVDSARILVTAQGSYEAAGRALVHNATLAGYRMELGGDGGPQEMLNSLVSLGPGDTLIAISLWRQYERTVRVAEVARELGATVCVITDSTGTALADTAHHRIVVPAEGSAFFPSVAAALAVAQGICAQLAAYDPARTRASLERSEALWDRFEVLHVPRDRGKDKS